LEDEFSSVFWVLSMDQRMQGQVEPDLVIKVAWKWVVVKHIQDRVVLKVVKQKVGGENVDLNKYQDTHNEFEKHSKPLFALMVSIFTHDEQEEGNGGDHESVFFVRNQ
jgi:hypothetical protein